MFARPLLLPAMIGAGWLAALSGCDATPARGRQAAREAPRAAELRSSAVQTALLHAGRALRTRGFAPVSDERRGFVVSRAALVHPAPLHGGRCYVAVGAGSAAIARLELTLHDTEGAPVAEAPASAGARPALRFCPPQSGTFYLAARAASGSGIVALRLFEGPGGLEVRVDDLFDGSAGADGPP